VTEASETATDAIEAEDQAPVPASKTRRSGDRIVAVTGFVLATAAAFFPWYVFFNQESFGIAPMGYSETRDLPETGGRSFVNVSPLAIPDEKDGSAEPSAFDPITTATVSNLGDEGTADRLRRLLTPTGRFPASRSTSCCMSPMAAR
jgi:hypothetical protein